MIRHKTIAVLLSIFAVGALAQQGAGRGQMQQMPQMQQMQQMQGRMQSMQAQMTQMQNTTDPAERQKLM